MTIVEQKFVELKVRYIAALQYEKERYQNDTPEGKSWAEKTFLELVRRIGQLWEEMSKEEKARHMDLFK